MSEGRIMRHDQPPARLLKAIRRSSRGGSPSPLHERRISDAYREILREYRTIASGGGLPGRRWRSVAFEALRYLGGDADRLGVTLREYDHHRYGPFLGVSDDGGAADDICRAARASPKAQALGGSASPLTLGRWHHGPSGVRAWQARGVRNLRHHRGRDRCTGPGEISARPGSSRREAADLHGRVECENPPRGRLSKSTGKEWRISRRRVAGCARQHSK
jgi:hypothetical protein